MFKGEKKVKWTHLLVDQTCFYFVRPTKSALRLRYLPLILLDLLQLASSVESTMKILCEKGLLIHMDFATIKNSVEILTR